MHCCARAPRLLAVWVPFVPCRVHNRDHYGAPTTLVGNQAQDLGTQSASPAPPQAHQMVHETPLWVSLCQEHYGCDHKRSATAQWHAVVGTRFGREAQGLGPNPTAVARRHTLL